MASRAILAFLVSGAGTGVVGSSLFATPIALASANWVIGVTNAASPAEANSNGINSPSNGSAGSPTSSSLVISWVAPTSGAPPSGYTVTRNGSAIPSGSGCYGTITATSCTDSGLSISTTYTYRVKSRVGTKWSSSASASFRGTTLS